MSPFTITMLLSTILVLCCFAPQEVESLSQNINIPKQIHFIYKTSNKEKLPAFKQKLLSSWEKYNPEYRIRIWNDQAADIFVKEHFPEHFNLYHQLTLVERTDMLRYMLLSIHGGVYADLDVECYRSVDSWHSDIHHGSVGLIVGIEADVTAVEENDYDLIRPQQISQWVFAGSKGHRVFECAVNLVAKRFHQFNVAGEKTIWNARETLKVTGPGVFTDCVMEYITAVGGGSLTDIRYDVLLQPPSELLVCTYILFVRALVFMCMSVYQHAKI
eukprot:m.1424598 g.1424598  ORF g.1424598 m.1424598 type:complete len:273 (-) comp25061_c0_seq38:139-957(-)